MHESKGQVLFWVVKKLISACYHESSSNAPESMLLPDNNIARNHQEKMQQHPFIITSCHLQVTQQFNFDQIY